MARYPERPELTGASQSPLHLKASPFVGRDNELRLLATALARSAQGQGGTVLLTGQRGIGKTRLAQQCLALAERQGFTVLEGQAFPLQTEMAYAPFLNLFGPMLRRFGPARLKALARDMPSLGHLFEDLPLPPREALDDPALEKARLFEAMSRLVHRLTEEGPVAIFVDDMQWFDTASLDMLHYLARGLANQRALLLATYTVTARHNWNALRALILALQRSGLAEEIIVPRLKPDAVEELVGGLLGGSPPDRLLAILGARADGTPLYIQALVTALVHSAHLVNSDHGWELDVEGELTLPTSVRHLILEHLGRLTQVDRRVVDLIAVMGNELPYTILRAASALEEEILLEALGRLRLEGLIAEATEGSDVTYSIAHPLIQEVAYAELPEIERRRAHEAAIKALERFHPKDVDRLARHYLGAGPQARGERALAALMAAGERALSVYANEEAARHFEAALGMARGSGQQIVPSALASLLERLGEAQERIGKREAAIQVWQEALALLSDGRERAGDHIAAARLASRLAWAEWDGGHFDASDAYFKAALAALAEHEPCQEMVDLLVAHFFVQSRIGDMAALAESAEKLLSISERLESSRPRAEAAASLAAATLCEWHNDIAGAQERAQHALMLAEGAKDLSLCCGARSVLVAIGMRLGDHQLIRYYAERGEVVAQRRGVPHWEVVFRGRLAFANFLCGAWDTSLQNGLEAVALARRIGSPRDVAYTLAERAMLLALRGDLSEAEDCVSEAKSTFGNPSGQAPADKVVCGLIDMAHAALELQRGSGERALEIARDFMNSSTLAAASARLIPIHLPRGLVLLAEARIAAGDPESAIETACALTRLAPLAQSM